MKTALAAIAALFATAAALAASDKREVSEAEFGDAWPFTVGSGYVQCLRGDSYVFLHGGKIYGLNGFGITFFGNAELRDIWKEDPKYPGLGLRVNIGPMFDAASELC